MEQVNESTAEKALKNACHDMAKMEAHGFMTTVDPTRADQLFQYYMQTVPEFKPEATK